MALVPRSPTFSRRIVRDPSVAIRSGPENYQNRLLNLYATPVGKAVGFDVVRIRRAPTDFGYRNEVLLNSLTSQNPFALYDWRIPGSYPQLPTSFVYGNEALFSLLPPPATPFAQYDWPLPRSYPPFSTSFVYGNDALFALLAPRVIPFAQYDWPLPLAFRVMRDLVGRGAYSGFFHSPGQPVAGQPPYFSPPPLLRGPFPRIVVPHHPITENGNLIDRVWWRHFSDTTQAVNMLVDALNQARADIVRLKNTDLINQ